MILLKQRGLKLDGCLLKQILIEIQGNSSNDKIPNCLKIKNTFYMLTHVKREKRRYSK